MNALLALAASLLWGTSDFGGGLISRRVSPAAAVFFSQGIALVGLLVLVPFVTVHGGGYLLVGAATGLVGSLSLTAFYQALATAPMSLVAPISAGGAIVPVLTGLLRGEHLGAIQAAGIGVALIGIVLASGPELRSGVPVRRQALGFAIGAGVGFGVAYTLLALAAGGGVFGTLLLQRIGGLVALAPIALRPAVLRTLRRSRDRAGTERAGTGGAVPSGAGGLNARWLVALGAVGICDISANGTYALAASRGQLAIAAVLASLYPVVTAMLARGFLAERLRPVQRAGVVAALAGVVLLST
jgi:drug/metabolite transporter (DMT)-like permease